MDDSYEGLLSSPRSASSSLGRVMSVEAVSPRGRVVSHDGIVLDGRLAVPGSAVETRGDEQTHDARPVVLVTRAAFPMLARPTPLSYTAVLALHFRTAFAPPQHDGKRDLRAQQAMHASKVTAASTSP